MSGNTAPKLSNHITFTPSIFCLVTREAVLAEMLRPLQHDKNLMCLYVYTHMHVAFNFLCKGTNITDCTRTFSTYTGCFYRPEAWGGGSNKVNKNGA